MYDCMSNMMCSRCWLGAQGYDVFENIFFQENKSANVLEDDGKDSSSKRTNHINIRKYFITDCIENMNSQ